MPASAHVGRTGPSIGATHGRQRAKTGALQSSRNTRRDQNGTSGGVRAQQCADRQIMREPARPPATDRSSPHRQWRHHKPFPSITSMGSRQPFERPVQFHIMMRLTTGVPVKRVKQHAADSAKSSPYFLRISDKSPAAPNSF